MGGDRSDKACSHRCSEHLSRFVFTTFSDSLIKPAVEYRGSDEASMADNNSSAFNCRKVKGSNRWSKHSFGEAIDINPLWNPWVKRRTDISKERWSVRLSEATTILGMINEGIQSSKF